jgi:multisubunit Na+/H+ antiporter MnhE subunit
MQGAADWAATILAGLIIIFIGSVVVDWLADRVISAVNWLTRHE